MNIKELETGLETKTEQVIFRLTSEEKQGLFKEAQKLGISTSAFIRLLYRSWLNGNVNINSMR